MWGCCEEGGRKGFIWFGLKGAELDCGRGCCKVWRRRVMSVRGVDDFDSHSLICVGMMDVSVKSGFNIPHSFRHLANPEIPWHMAS